MIFQYVVKGIAAQTPREPGLSDAGARGMVSGDGLHSNWWRSKGRIAPHEVQQVLSERALRAHLVDYDAVRDTTPFISTTAGTVERDPAAGGNLYFPPLYTALRFATRNFTADGYVVHAYVMTLGKKSVEMREFAEEVRDLNTYTDFYAWHPEGEVVAKVHVPAARIEKIERYDLAEVEEALEELRIPVAAETFDEPDIYREPLQYANVRGFPGVTW